jgi:hypothetical protein
VEVKKDATRMLTHRASTAVGGVGMREQEEEGNSSCITDHADMGACEGVGVCWEQKGIISHRGFKEQARRGVGWGQKLGRVQSTAGAIARIAGMYCHLRVGWLRGSIKIASHEDQNEPMIASDCHILRRPPIAIWATLCWATLIEN